jgi:hypothetical protein
MATFTKIPLSASTDGRGVLVVATATAGTLLHTGHASDEDECWLYGYNSHTAPIILTIEWGGVSDPADHITSTLAFDVGVVEIIPGLVITNSLAIRGYASVASKVSIFGFCNRITP